MAIAACSGMDGDSHFHKIYDNDTGRVFTLEIGRLESTTTHCHDDSYFYVVTSESQTTDTQTGHATARSAPRVPSCRLPQLKNTPPVLTWDSRHVRVRYVGGVAQYHYDSDRNMLIPVEAGIGSTTPPTTLAFLNGHGEL